jgi:MoaA/NifB/PqqE/SkfB family radical SAM enzyme
VILPPRLNLAIGRRCYLSCPGCYQLFGGHEPDLRAFETAALRFVEQGLDRVTVSGGDPLTISGLILFLESLRAGGMIDIKVDTVGTALLRSTSKWVDHPEVSSERLTELLAAVDFLGLPLDGWSPTSATSFRHRRPHLFAETNAILSALDELPADKRVVINTVAHRGNMRHLHQIYRELARHPCIGCWNVFQYTPTDQVRPSVNNRFVITEADLWKVRSAIALEVAISGGARFSVNVQTIRSRLGQYLLINSDGEAWLPDENGSTVRLGLVAGNETEILKNWSTAVRGEIVFDAPIGATKRIHGR